MILNSKSHSETYPILGWQLMEALQSDSVEHQAAAMLVLRVVLITTPEFALKDAETIMEAITLEDEENLILQHAACYVLEVFGETFSSMNVYIIKILSKLISLFFCESNEVRGIAYTAALTLYDRIDCKLLLTPCVLHRSFTDICRRKYGKGLWLVKGDFAVGQHNRNRSIIKMELIYKEGQ